MVGRDPLVAAVLCALGYVELFVPARYGGDPVWPGPTAANVVLVAASTLPLAWRRRYPTAAPAGALLALGLGALLLGGAEATTSFLVFLVASFELAVQGRRSVLCASFVVLVGAVHELRDPHVQGVGDVVWGFGIMMAGWLAGWAVRTRQRRIGDLEDSAARASREHAEQVERATAAERAAIARELHDIVSHLVAVIVIQAQAGTRALPREPAVAAEVLATIESSGRAALGELRQLLGMLSGGDETASEPLASLSRLPELVERCRQAGLRVEVSGEPPTGLGLLTDATAYRVVQEALTNTIRHAPGAAVRVSVRAGDGRLVLEVADDGGGGGGGAAGTGRGLIGMRERIALVRGELEVGPHDRGWRMRAVLPLDEVAAQVGAGLP
ncbi:sensor histidine kinase [Microlunatus elymi]|uniref:histidine kinase n=1 Tax=Microlunatus elymi TaxID=2596828 RepID=A0A516Q305_9ACTN|nr:histidine kinase [Microlunatus elymi]QDP97817.1 sensor histidine kinase [Microlunatus elymi]